MPYGFVVAVPNASRVLLTYEHICASVGEVDDRVAAVGEHWDAYPHVDRARPGIVRFDFVVELRGAGVVRSEDDVIAVGILYLAATVRRGKEGVDARDENWEVGLIGVGNLGVVDRDGAVMTIRGARNNQRDRAGGRCARVGGAGGGHDHLLAGRRRGRSVQTGGFVNMSRRRRRNGPRDWHGAGELLRLAGEQSYGARRNDDWRKKVNLRGEHLRWIGHRGGRDRQSLLRTDARGCRVVAFLRQVANRWRTARPCDRWIPHGQEQLGLRRGQVDGCRTDTTKSQRLRRRRFQIDVRRAGLGRVRNAGSGNGNDLRRRDARGRRVQATACDGSGTRRRIGNRDSAGVELLRLGCCQCGPRRRDFQQSCWHDFDSAYGQIVKPDRQGIC